MEAARRRIGGWGFEGERLLPSPALLGWLEARLGAGLATPAQAMPLHQVVAAEVLPEMGTALGSDPQDRLTHARGQGLPDLIRLRSGRLPPLPAAVVRPADAGELARVLRTCSDSGVRIIPWGGGTSVTGGVNVPADGMPTVSLDLERLSGLRELDACSGQACFGAGTVGPEVELALRAEGWTLGHFPQSFELSTLGGWVVTRSSGQESLRYGRIEDLVAGLDLEAPAGHLSLPALPASAAGPDLRQLVMGSEGRFGIVSEVTVRVRPRPETTRVVGFLMPTWESGVARVRELAQQDVGLAMLRLSDQPETEVAMAVGLAGRRLSGLARRFLALRGVAAGCLLLCGASGTRRHCRRALAAASEVVQAGQGIALGEGPGRRWQADRFRHPYLRDGLLDAGFATETLETAAPWSRLAALRRCVTAALGGATEENGRASAVLCHLSHPYRDGASLYFTFFFACPRDPDQAVAHWARLKRRATEAICAAGGALSHHHGVGQWHAPWLAREVGADGVRLLAEVSSSLDPAGILNPRVLLNPTDELEKA